MNRDYLYIEPTESFCMVCEQLVPAKIIAREGRVYIAKSCKDHGITEGLLEEDAAYHKKKRHYDKPGTAMKVYTEVDRGCPYDCGTCPTHDQHACIGLIEVTSRCDLQCPVCFAEAGANGHCDEGGNQGFVSLERIGAMIDRFIESEFGNGEILQISGGEPTLHPQILDIIQMARDKGINHVLLNTNGKRLAEDEAFVKALSAFKGGFEVYLQFDGFKAQTYLELRGKQLLPMKEQALKHLKAYGVPATLVMTVAKGVNEDEVGKVFLYGVGEPFIRGVNYQPLAFFGRLPLSSFNGKERTTLSSILKAMTAGTGGMLTDEDFLPLPCNVERVAITYLARTKKEGFIPITRHPAMKKYIHLINNTFNFTIEAMIKQAQTEEQKSLKAALNSSCCDFMEDFKRLIPKDYLFKSKEEKRHYIDHHTFRVSISSFVDKANFDLKSMQKECVHVITEDLRKIPFSAYNMLYRQEG